MILFFIFWGGDCSPVMVFSLRIHVLTRPIRKALKWKSNWNWNVSLKWACHELECRPQKTPKKTSCYAAEYCCNIFGMHCLSSTSNSLIRKGVYECLHWKLSFCWLSCWSCSDAFILIPREASRDLLISRYCSHYPCKFMLYFCNPNKSRECDYKNQFQSAVHIHPVFISDFISSVNLFLMLICMVYSETTPSDGNLYMERNGIRKCKETD